MQNLKQLVQLLTAKGKNSLGLFEKYSLRTGKELSLYKGITSGSFQTDQQAAKSLYSCSSEDSRYIVLKMRLEEKLLNYLLYVESSEAGYKSGKRPLHKCEVQLFQARMLMSHGKLSMGERLVKKALRVAREYEYNGLVCQMLELLLDVYTQRGASLLYQQIKQTYVDLLQVVAIEGKAAELFREATLRLGVAGVEGPNLASLSKAVSALEGLWRETLSYNCFDLYYRLHVEELQLEGKYPQLVVLTMLSEEFIRDLKINAKRFDAAHNHALQVYALFRTNDIGHGLALAKKGKSLFTHGSTSWLHFVESYFLLAMHDKDYRLAGEIILEVEQVLTMHKSASNLLDKWKLFRLYVAWMNGENHLPESLQEILRQTLPAVQKDKQGYNIAFLILQFCFYLGHHQKDVLSTKAETYKKYMERHMGGANLVREHIFFLLLLLVVRHNFNYEQIVKKASRLLLQLKQAFLPGGAAVSAVEIVPYEGLWQRLMQTLWEMKELKSKSAN